LLPRLRVAVPELRRVARAERRAAAASPMTVLDDLRAALLDGDAIQTIPRPLPLIDDVLDLDSLAVLYGRSGAGKSFAALGWALSVATGAAWHGSTVTRGRVLYVVAEGAAGMGARLDAWLAHERRHSPGEITWLPAAPSLIQRDTRTALETIATELHPRLVVLDTLARLIPGGDENSHQTMSTVVDAADRIRRATGACVLLVHHTGKDTSAGARGHTSLLGAVDTEIACEAAERIITLRATKQKHHADGHIVARLRLHDLGSSCVLVPYSGEILDNDDLTKNETLALEVLASIQVDGGISYTEWKRAAVDAGVGDGSFARVRARLVTAELITNIGTDKAPRYRTASAVGVIRYQGSVTTPESRCQSVSPPYRVTPDTSPETTPETTGEERRATPATTIPFGASDDARDPFASEITSTPGIVL
jgi:hypothetical protein